jgi:hypothetical protein
LIPVAANLIDGYNKNGQAVKRNSHSHRECVGIACFHNFKIIGIELGIRLASANSSSVFA